MKKQYIYSNNKEFLGKLDNLKVQEQWVKITLLNYNEETPLEDIEGEIISGNLTKSGTSSVRCTCSLSCAINAFKYNIDDIKSKYSISKKIYLELGVTNSTDEFLDEEIIWFPQGVFFITGCSITASATGSATLSLDFKDKMAQLDGTIGGVLPATTRFDTVTTIEDGTTITKKTLVYDIIMETVNHFGNESISNIIIDDIPKKAKRIIRWMGTEPMWIYPISKDGRVSYDICFNSDIDEKKSAYKGIVVDQNKIPIAAKEYQPGQDIGYTYEDFIYDDELTFNSGSKVTDVLDKIKEWLGNYEYFYDEYGQFHFQEIKNYLNNSESAEMWEKIIHTDDTDYLYESTYGKTVYTFDDKINLISITNTPSFDNIKNDFIVEGTTTRDNVRYTCRYHLVIDEKPSVTIDGYDNTLIYTDPLTNNVTLGNPKIINPVQINNKWTWSLPEFGESGVIYGLLDEPQVLTLEKRLSDMGEFAVEYNTLVNQERTLITSENAFSLFDHSSNGGINVKKYLFDILEKYMGYDDKTPYKEKYRDTIFTLVRQLRRYNTEKEAPLLASTNLYYGALNKQYQADMGIYGEEVSANIIAWCGGLLQLLYDTFNITAGERPSNTDFIDNDYWPAINTSIPYLWDNMPAGLVGDELRMARKKRCLEYVDDIKIKQRELNVLIEQYTQMLNECNVQIEINKRRSQSITQLILDKDSIQNQINNYKAQVEICDKRLVLLYSVLTALGAVSKTYYIVNIDINVRSTSFWYYEIDKTKDTYGWNELVWYKYYRNKTDSTPPYPDGLGSMTYIDYNAIDLNYTTFNNDNYPSMNRYSSWYQNYYKPYAREHDLPYFDSSVGNTYVPQSWRTELLLQGLRAEANGTDPGDYYQELKANWPTVYDFRTNQLLSSSVSSTDYFVGDTAVILGTSGTYQFGDSNLNTDDIENNKFLADTMKINSLSSNYENDCYYYFFDIIDSSSTAWGEYSVNNIGRRTNVNVSNGVNCIFAPKIPDFAFINVSNLTTQERAAAYAELADVAEDIIQVTDAFYNNFTTGGYKQSAYEQIKYDLQQYTSYQNNVSILAVPCFYLEPNTRVEINDHSTGTFGDYIIRSVSISLGSSGNTMSVDLSKAMKKN